MAPKKKPTAKKAAPSKSAPTEEPKSEAPVEIPLVGPPGDPTTIDVLMEEAAESVADPEPVEEAPGPEESSVPVAVDLDGPRSFSGWQGDTVALIGLDTYAKGGRPREIVIDFEPDGIEVGTVEWHLAHILAQRLTRLQSDRKTRHDALLHAREAAAKCAEKLEIYRSWRAR